MKSICVIDEIWSNEKILQLMNVSPSKKPEGQSDDRFAKLIDPVTYFNCYILQTLNICSMLPACLIMKVGLEFVLETEAAFPLFVEGRGKVLSIKVLAAC